MMPDKSDASDTSPDESVDDQSADTRVVDDKMPDAADGSGDAAARKAESATEPAPADSPDGDDPLGFGEQRMGDADIEDVDELDELGQLRVQLEQAESKAADHWDRLLRLQADMENQRKRAQNDVTKARKYALEGIVSDLLPVKDSLEMGLAAAGAEDADPAAIVEGAELTLKMLSQVFEKNNILEVNPVDEKFDPEFHQAMSMQEIEGKVPNTVASVMQKGYTLNERLVRPALVMVAK